MPGRNELEAVFTDGWTEEEKKAYAADQMRRKRDQSFFIMALAPSPFHWHFQQARDALASDLFLPGISGLLNGIEASLRTLCCQVNGRSLDGDLGSTMSNRLLTEAKSIGLKIENLAFPHEADFLKKTTTKDAVKIVNLRHDICHGNFQNFVRRQEDIGEYFTPECLGPISAELLGVSYNWALEVSRFMEAQGWRTADAGLQPPENPLKHWLS